MVRVLEYSSKVTLPCLLIVHAHVLVITCTRAARRSAYVRQYVLQRETVAPTSKHRPCLYFFVAPVVGRVWA
jgi:hypothetical protein